MAAPHKPLFNLLLRGATSGRQSVLSPSASSTRINGRNPRNQRSHHAVSPHRDRGWGLTDTGAHSTAPCSFQRFPFSRSRGNTCRARHAGPLPERWVGGQGAGPLGGAFPWPRPLPRGAAEPAPFLETRWARGRKGGGEAPLTEGTARRRNADLENEHAETVSPPVRAHVRALRCIR